MIRPAAALAAAAIVLAACGGDDGGRFDEQVADVREAVEAGDRETAVAGLDAIALLALDASQRGELTDAEAAEVAALVEQGRALVDQQLPAAEPASTTPPPEPAPEPPAEAEDDDEREDDDEEDDDDKPGKGKGRGGGGDDD